MTQTISPPEEISTSWRSPALSSHERRVDHRKAPDQLIYLSLPSNNGGIVLDLSEGGLRFHSIAPVDRDAPIHFRFAIDSGAKVRGVGELAWLDETGKTGGLRFTQLPSEVREQIRVWTGQMKSTATASQRAGESAKMNSSAAVRRPALPAATTTPQLPAGTEKTSGYTFSAGAVAPKPKSATPFADGTKLAVASIAGTLVPEPLNREQIAHVANDEIPGVWEARNPLLYNLAPPVYSAPYNKLSLFPLNPDADAAAAVSPLNFMAEEKSLARLESAAQRNPVAAVTLTVVLAFIVTIGIFAYLSTSGVGELLISWGQEMWSGSDSQPVSRNLAPPANSVADSSRAGQH